MPPLQDRTAIPPVSTPVPAVSLGLLGARLQAIFDVIAGAESGVRYDRIWDCCCDHGYLGTQIVNHRLCDVVVFVDQLPHLIAQLDDSLKQFPAATYQTLAADAGDLLLAADARHLLVLAGVGGEHTVSMLQKITARHPHQSIDFIFCPSTSQFDLREYLHGQRFELRSESLITEKGRQYEVIYVRWHGADPQGIPVSVTGAMWDSTNSEHQTYRAKLIAHYTNRLRSDPSGRSKTILDAYVNIDDHPE